MSAVIRQEYSEAQLGYNVAREEVCHIHREHAQHAILVRREVEGRVRSVESEVERPQEGAIASRIREAGHVHDSVVTALRAEVEEAASRTKTLEMKAAELDNRRLAMGSGVLEPTKAGSALEARCQTLQVQHGEVVEPSHRANAVRERAVEETIARLQTATGTLEAEVCVLRSGSFERSATSNGVTAILRSTLETALRVSQSGKLERARTEVRSTTSVARSNSTG